MAYELQRAREGSRVCRYHQRQGVSQLILQDVADVSKARTWLGSSEMKTVLEKSGVIGSPTIRFAA
jgi:hypothetical protein